MGETRIAWLDAYRGFGMILVILGHMTIPDLCARLIYSFHMPLFFFMSGYLYKGGFSASWALHKVDSLLVPYVIYGLLTVGVWAIVGIMPASQGAGALVIGNGLGVTWFFACLLAVELFAGAILCRFKRRKEIYIVLVFVALGGWLIPHLHLKEVCKSNVILAALTFWLFGWVVKGRAFRRYELVAAAVFALFFWTQRVDMASAEFGNGFLFYGVALGLIVLTIDLFRRCDISWRPLRFVGERSLEFMCLHALIPLFLTFVFRHFGIEFPKPLLRILFLTLVACAAWAVHRYVPILSGRARVFQRLLG